MPAPAGRAPAGRAAKAPVPAAATSHLLWRPLLTQLSEELERLEGENQRLHELLGIPVPPAAVRRSCDDIQEIPSPATQVVCAPAIPANSRKQAADASWSQVLQSRGLLPPGSSSVVLRNQWMGEGSDSLANTLKFRPSSEASKLSTANGNASKLSAADGNATRPLPTPETGSRSVTLRAGSANSKGSKLLLPDQAKFTIMRAQRTKQFVAAKPWYVINPDSSRLASIWQMMMVLSLLFVAFITPMQVGLFHLELDALFLASLGVDFLFFIDMLLQFLTSYPKTTPQGVVWEVRLTKICCNYLRTWFFLDFITLLPFELLTFSLGVKELRELTTIKVLRALRLLKLLRLAKTSRAVQDMEVPMSIPYQQMALCRFLVVLGLTCHWLACLWSMTLLLVDTTYPQWIDSIESADAEFGIRTRESPSRVYIAAFYFCTYTLTSVGYGDISPQNILERTFLAAMLLVAGLCWAYIIGEVGGIVKDITKESQEFRKRMHHLNHMMKDQGLPFGLQCRLRRFFLQNKHQSIFKARQLLMERMSPQLRAEACIAINLGWLQKVSFFKQFMEHIEDLDWAGEFAGPHRACVYDISRSLQLQAFAQQESFDNVQVLFILSKGLVVLNRRVGAHGEVWGEDFVLADTSLIQPVAGYALTYIELLSLTREAFMDVIERRRLTCPELANIVRRYCIRVAVFRGVLAEARRRLRVMQTTYPEIQKIGGDAAPKAPAGPPLPGEITAENVP